MAGRAAAGSAERSTSVPAPAPGRTASGARHGSGHRVTPPSAPGEPARSVPAWGSREPSWSRIETQRCPTSSAPACACSSSGSTRDCGRPPWRRTSPTRATASTRRCGKAGVIERDIDRGVGMTDDDRAYLIARGIGITNLVARATAKASEVSTAELHAGGVRLLGFVRQHHPVVVAVAGVTAYRAAFDVRDAVAGRQPEPFGGAVMWIVPNPSGLNAHETIDSLAAAYREPAVVAGIVAPVSGWNGRVRGGARPRCGWRCTSRWSPAARPRTASGPASRGRARPGWRRRAGGAGRRAWSGPTAARR